MLLSIALSSDMILRIFLLICFLCPLLFAFTLMLWERSGSPVIATLTDKATGKVYEISSWETSIGRAKLCDVVLSYATVSRLHAVITRRKKSWIIFDTNSSLGIKVNGLIVKNKASLYDGDTISLGGAEFIFRALELPVRKKKTRKK